MNQDVYEEDNPHLDADYRAVQKTRKHKDERASWQAVQQELDKMDGPPEAINGMEVGVKHVLPDHSSGYWARQRIFEAAKGDDVDALRLYFVDECQSMADWSFRDPETGETVLNRALAHRSYRAVAFLLSTRQAGDLVSASYDEDVGGQVSRRTSLHQAIETGRLDVVRSLLSALEHRHTRKLLLSQGALRSTVGRRPRTVTCLHIAAMKGFDDIVEHVVSVCGVDVNEANEFRDTALMWASLEGHLTTVALLVRLQANVNAANDQGSTALHYAVRNKHAEVARLLLEQGGANANARRNRGLECPLVLAAAMGSVDIVRLLVKHGADVTVRVHGSETALHYAASEGHLEVCQILVDAGAELDATDSVGETALLEAARRGELEIMDYLLGHRASLGKVTVDGGSAWTYAIESPDDRMLMVLLKHVRNNSIDYDDIGYSSNVCKSRLSLRLSHRIKLPDIFLPLHAAAKRGDIAKLRILLSQHVSADDRDVSGNTFVHAAAATNQWQLLEKVAVSRWASAVNNEGRTPLHEACRLAHEKSVAALAKITKLDIRSSCGSTVLHEAARASDNQNCLSSIRHIMKQIRLGRYWSLLDAQDDRGYTALHWAVKGGCKEILKELRALSLCVNDRDGNTPLHLAAEFGDANAFAELLRLHSKEVPVAFQQTNASGMTPIRLAINRNCQAIVEHAIRAGADVTTVEPDGKTVLHWIADKIVADESTAKDLMQTVTTITDMSVVWWATTKKQQMPDHPSPQYEQMKITALKTLFGNTIDNEGLTVMQFAASIGCLPLIKHILNLTGVFKTYYNPDEYDVTDFLPHTVTVARRNFWNHKVLPESSVSAINEETYEKYSPVKDYANGKVPTSKQVTSILELVVSNRDSIAAEAVLEISPFCDMAKPYWRWYQWLWVTVFLFHAAAICLLTVYGIKHTHSFNETDVQAASSLSPDCSAYQLPRTVVFILLAYVLFFISIMITSLMRMIYYGYQVLTRHICGNSRKRTYHFKSLDWYSDPVGEAIWKSCGLTFGWTTAVGLLLNLYCIPYQEYPLSVAMLCGWMYLIYFLTRLRILYQYSLMLQRIVGVCLTFFVVFMFILLGFSFAQQVAIRSFEKYAHQVISDTAFITFQWLIGMNSFWDIDVPSDDIEFMRYLFLVVLYAAYIGLCTIVLMNLLIATMTDSFNGVRNDSGKLWRVESLRRALAMQRSKSQGWLVRFLNSAAVRSFYPTQNVLRYDARQHRWFLELLKKAPDHNYQQET